MADQTGTASDDILYGTNDPDVLVGLAGGDKLFAFGGNDTLDGGDGSDLLDGGEGADTMSGGNGDDYYTVDDPGDQVLEFAVGGTDLVFTTTDFALPTNIERLAAYDESSTYALRLTGNTLDNEIIGNDGPDLLIGGGGKDLMRGGGGDDTYIVDSADDVCGEVVNGGYDAIYVKVVTSTALHNFFEYTLMRTAGPYGVLRLQSVAVEQLSVYDSLSTNSVNLRGSLQNDLLTGNNGINVFEGHEGNDIMRGYGGDDYYFIGEAGDVVIEDADGGYDTVILGRYTPLPIAGLPGTVTSYTLPDNFERLMGAYTLREQGYDLTGNALDNEIVGSLGGDQLDGGDGRDVLTGGNGVNNVFVFSSTPGEANADQLPDFRTGRDHIVLDHTVFTGLQPGSISDGQFRRGTSAWQAQDADDHILYDASTGNLYFDVDGSGSASPVIFATVHEGLDVTASDFFII
jgi:serralysin